MIYFTVKYNYDKPFVIFLFHKYKIAKCKIVKAIL